MEFENIRSKHPQSAIDLWRWTILLKKGFTQKVKIQGGQKNTSLFDIICLQTKYLKRGARKLCNKQ
jgi:hypothetical protein